jgi:hypothetical protein
MKKKLPRFTPFAELSRRRRRDLYISLRWRISQDKSIYGGNFTSRYPLDEPNRHKLDNQWFHFDFLGTNGFTVWRATIRTATWKFWEETSALAGKRADSLLTEEQREHEYGLHWLVPVFKNEGKYYRMVKRQPQTYDCFDGLTLHEYMDKIELEIITKEPPAIYETFAVDCSYRSGMGLQVIVHADEINRDVIESTIERFRQVGEQNWQSISPVSRQALPIETQEAALAKVEYSK